LHITLLIISLFVVLFIIFLIVMLLRWPKRWWNYFFWQLVHHFPNYHVLRFSKLTKKMMSFFSFFVQHLVHHLPICHLVHQLLVYHLAHHLPNHHVLRFSNRKLFFSIFCLSLYSFIFYCCLFIVFFYHPSS
jgi:hypothetical protein